VPQKRETRLLGNKAEDFAVSFITSKGYKVLVRNFHSRFGEIDIIAVDNDTLVFVEVKARWSNKFGTPEEAVTQGKLWKIQKTGEYYSKIHPELPKKLRVDVVAIQIDNGQIVTSKIIKVY